MCNIFGLIKRNHSYNVNNFNLCHRGPDDQGVFSDESVLFLHNRLSIQDLSPMGHQPMISSDGNFVIIYNGEIYNHKEVRTKLTPKYNFKSSSDTETLLYGFIEYGKEIVNLINGIFSFVIYNIQSGEIFIARDPLGVKPLYYFQNKHLFAFASEIKSLIHLNDFDFTLDKTSFLNNLLFLHNLGESTNYSSVKKLLPGHYIELNCHKPELFKITKYYNIPFNGTYSNKSEAELTKELEEILFRTIEKQSIADVPIGCFLSGGIDSSLLVALTKAIYPNKEMQCFTYRNISSSYEGFEDDYPFAQYLANKLNIKLEVIDTPINLEELDTIIYHLDEAQTDPAAFHSYLISKRANQLGYKVLFSGIGADELFSGYRRHRAIKLYHFIKYIPEFALKGIQKTISMLPSNNANLRRIQKAFKYAHSNPLENLFSYYLWQDPLLTQMLFKKEIRDGFKNYTPFDYYQDLLDNIPNEPSILNKMLYWDLKSYLPNNNLNYTDKMGMANGVEIRVPYLDTELISFSTSLPPSLKLKDTTTKYLLRKVAEKHLPEKIIHRSKTGFGSPVRQLVKNEWAKSISERLNKEELNKYNLFDYDQIQNLLIQNKKGKIDAAYSIFSLLTIQSWLKQFSR